MLSGSVAKKLMSVISVLTGGVPFFRFMKRKNGTPPVSTEITDISFLATDPLSILLGKLQSMRDGDFSVRLPGDWTGLQGKIADTFNEIVAANQKMADELKRVGQ